MSIDIKTKKFDAHKDGIAQEVMLNVQSSIYSSIIGLGGIGVPMEFIMEIKCNLDLLNSTIWALFVCALKINNPDGYEEKEIKDTVDVYKTLLTQFQDVTSGFMKKIDQIKTFYRAEPLND